MTHHPPPRSGKYLERDGDDRRQVILDAAQALIVEAGLEGFRIREVAQRAGMHHASLLHYFPNREALIRGVVLRIVDTLDRVPTPGSSDVALPPRAALHTHFQHVLRQIQTYPERFIVLNELALRARRDPESAQVLTEIDASWLSYLLPLLEAGRTHGAFRPDLDVEATAWLITSCFKGLSTHAHISSEHWQRTLAQLERWIIGDDSRLEW